LKTKKKGDAIGNPKGLIYSFLRFSSRNLSYSFCSSGDRGPAGIGSAATAMPPSHAYHLSSNLIVGFIWIN